MTPTEQPASELEQPTTTEEPEAEKPMTEEEEFESRLSEEMETEKIRDKEIRYQLFRLQRPPFNLEADRLAGWRERPDCKLGIELVWVTRKPFVYRNLSLGEYTKIAETVPDLPALRKKVTMAVVLWPALGATESDLNRVPAGITQTITESCLRTSGFEEVVALPV